MPSKQRRVAEENSIVARIQKTTEVPDVPETSKIVDGSTTQSSQEISFGEPIVPPYNGSKKLPVARLLYTNEPAGKKEKLAEEEEESDDDLVEEVMASPPPCEYGHGEDLEDDLQLTLDNLKKFQVNIREFSKFSVVSIKSSTFFLYIWGTGS